MVRSAPGFADAYKQFAQGGWASLAAPVEHGGQGLPKTLEVAVLEMIQASNMAFGLCPMLSLGAIEALELCGTDSQKHTYLPRLISGEWTGTMNLTEPQAGSDLAALTTIATPDGDGGWKITGQKIFITWGDHDAADNIVHLILARTPDAPPGVKGISLFLAPKVLVDADGKLGEANALRVGGLEHKLGIHGSPTCVMLFEGAKAELVGGLGQGLPNMFVMMNAARLQVGAQGVAIAERALPAGPALQPGTRPGPLGLDGRLSLAPVRPSGRAPLAGADEGPYRSRARHLPVDRRRRRPVARRRRRGDPHERQAARGTADPDRQGLVDRCRRLGRLSRAADPRRHGLHRGDRRGPALSRRPHRPDLRGDQRHPGHRSRGPQAVDG